MILERPEGHIDAIADPDKIAKLFAIGIGRVFRAKQADGAALAYLGVQMRRDAALAAFVIFVRPIDIEELQTDPARRDRLVTLRAAQNESVEDVLAPTIRIERTQHAEIIIVEPVQKPVLAISVGRRRRRVDQWNLGPRAEPPQINR